ncbi:hypothetical protein ACQ3I4_05175 [Zafaria sp. Z1313]|uniref:hypothetical protein n=1 Tax=unclassified Zafaria TaxID=2828765 RepID=UPI002E761DFA|nr:hypothetical protein [Zafaria sp. J156]MEE1621357.1 hypothetical protein [Zafaria sp. J156]
MALSATQDDRTATALAGPFTLRELVAIGGGLLLLIGSVLPFQTVPGTWTNLWILNGLLFNQLVTLALPLAVAGAFAWRRASGRRLVRIGSLTLDQLGSVVGILTGLYFFFAAVLSMNASFLLGLLGAAALISATTAAAAIPGFAADFEDGDGPLLLRAVRATEAASAPGSGTAPSKAAALWARATSGRSDGADPAAGGSAVVPVSVPAPGATGMPAAPAAGDDAEASATSDPAGARAAGAAAENVADQTADESASEPESVPEPGPAEEPAPETAIRSVVAHQPAPETVAASVVEPAPAAEPEPEEDEEPWEATRRADDAPVYQAFWFAVPQTRQIWDERTGSALFTVEPGAWILALEDRGGEFLVQDNDGRIGVLRDLANVERA